MTGRHGAGVPPRAEHVVSRELDGEFVVLDAGTDRAHHLHGDVAEVWRAAGEGGSVDLPPARLAEIVDELDDLGLLETPSDPRSRRSLLRAGAAGGAALAVAGIQTIVLPTAAFAASNDLPFANATPGTYTFNVPYYVNSVTFTLRGAGGGGAGRVGGGGALINGTITFPTRTSGLTAVTVVVGSGGASGASGTGGTGFGNGGNGGNGAGGGGGASAIVIDGVPVVVAAGGGGSGSSDTNANRGARGGNGGLFNSLTSSANTGQAGADIDLDTVDPDNATGGFGGRTLANRTQQIGAGGSGGIDGGAAGEDGGATASGGKGGDGGDVTGAAGGGGGGGGGWAGGGGGQAGSDAANTLSAGAGGAGGSSMFRNAAGCTVAIGSVGLGPSATANANGSNGSVSVSALP